MKPLRTDPLLRPTALEVHGLSKAFGAKQALRDVGFVVPEGSLTVLLGPAGAGKTTTLRLIAGLDRPDAGDVVMRGRDVSRLQPKDRDVAMIFDNLALYPNKTGFANIANPLSLRGVNKSDIADQVSKLAGVLRIAHVLNRLPKTMSGGERQRVALGRALIRNPSLFLLDEPLSSLDAMLRIELRAELKRLQRELGATFLLATPDFAEAMAVADMVVMLRDGGVVQIATAQSLYESPADRHIARFVGAPEINLLNARFEPDNEGRVLMAGASIAGLDRLRTILPKGGGAFEIGIRPEHLTLVPPADAPIRAEVSDIEPLGLRSVLTVKNDDAEMRLVIDASTAALHAPGDNVGIAVADDGLLAFDLVTGARYT